MRAPYAGVASATVNATQQVGGSIGTALLSTVAIAATLAYVPPAAQSGGGPAPAQVQSLALVAGYTAAFWWGVAIFLVGAVVSAIVLPNGKPEPATAEHNTLVAV